MKFSHLLIGALVPLAASGALGFSTASATTFKLTGATKASSIPGFDVDGDTTVTTITIGHVIGEHKAVKTALATQFPTWTFTYAAGLGGSLNVNTYVPT